MSNVCKGIFIFKNEGERVEYDRYAHDRLKLENEMFATWSEQNMLPPPIITCCGRTPTENGSTKGSAKNSAHLLDPENGDTSFEALDYRIRHYRLSELPKVVDYWKRRELDSNGRVKFVDNLNHGTAPHLHIEVIK